MCHFFVRIEKKVKSMISQTFLNLKEDKKNRIIKAAKKEFSRVPLDKALVSNIIRDSNIPRGSFYQYFENIDDLFVYIIDEIYLEALEELKINEDNKDKNYFDILKSEFFNVLTILDNGENRQFNLNIYMSFINSSLPNSKLIKEMNRLKNNEDIPKDIKDLPNSNIFMGLIEMSYITCLNDFILKGKSKEDVFSEYKNYLDYIKHTIIKTNNLGK